MRTVTSVTGREQAERLHYLSAEIMGTDVGDVGSKQSELIILYFSLQLVIIIAHLSHLAGAWGRP
jgi:hypothetical protein